MHLPLPALGLRGVVPSGDGLLLLLLLGGGVGRGKEERGQQRQARRHHRGRRAQAEWGIGGSKVGEPEPPHKPRRFSSTYLRWKGPAHKPHALPRSPYRAS